MVSASILPLLVSLAWPNLGKRARFFEFQSKDILGGREDLRDFMTPEPIGQPKRLRIS
jgi:hypothetical protein